MKRLLLDSGRFCEFFIFFKCDFLINRFGPQFITRSKYLAEAGRVCEMERNIENCENDFSIQRTGILPHRRRAGVVLESASIKFNSVPVLRSR